MSFLSHLFGTDNPTRAWNIALPTPLTVDLEPPALQGVAFGQPLTRLEFLGRGTYEAHGVLRYPDLGLDIDWDADGTIAGYTFFFTPAEHVRRPFPGVFRDRAGACPLSATTHESVLRARWGEPYWRADDDEEEIILFYEHGPLEWQVELTPTGLLRVLIITNAPLLADDASRTAYRVTKPWPPV